MANYLLLYSNAPVPQVEAELRAGLRDWDNWVKSIGGAMLDEGYPTTGRAKTIASDGHVTNGSRLIVDGYSVIKADSLEEAVAIAQNSPILKIGPGGAQIAVLETYDGCRQNSYLNAESRGSIHPAGV